MQQRGELNYGERISYAFGQSIGLYRGLDFWSHTGSWAGFRTILLRFPEQRFAVVILSNLSSYNPSDEARAIADIYLDDLLGPRAQDGDAAGANGGPAEPQSYPAGDLNDYLGEFYSEELDTSYWLSVRDGTLVAHHRRHGDIELLPLLRDEFRSNQWFVPSLEFDRDERDRVIAFRITQGRSRNMRFALRGSGR